MRVPDDPPATCPACGAPYDSVSEHDDGVLVNLLDNERYRRVCFTPVSRDGVARVHFFHHTHDQVGGDPPGGDTRGDGVPPTDADPTTGEPPTDSPVEPN